MSRERAVSMRSKWVPNMGEIALPSRSIEDVRELETATLEGQVSKVAARENGGEQRRQSLELGSLLVDVSGSALLSAVWSGEEEKILRVLEQEPSSVNDRDPNRGTLAILLASQWQEEKGARIMRMLLDHNADVAVTNNFGNNPLNRAALCSPSVALLLVEHIAAKQYDMRRFIGAKRFTALHYAAQCKSAAEEKIALLVRELVEKLHLDVNAVTEGAGCTPLHFAVECDLTEVSAALLDLGADPNHCRTDGCTAVHMCAQRGNIALMEKLLEQGGDLGASGSFGTALNLATVAGHEVMVRFLLGKGLDPCANFPQGTSVYAACDKGQLTCLKVLLEHGGTAAVNLVPTHPRSVSPLMISTYKSYVEIVTVLLESGANPSLPEDPKGVTPLHLASQKGNDELVRLFLGAKADPNRVCPKIGTALHAACLRGNTSTVQVLLDHKADPALNTVCGTPLYSASEKGQVECLRILLENNATTVLEATPLKERTQSPLMMAIQQGHNNVVQMLLSYGANADAARFDGITPLYFASNKNKLACAKSLLLAGAQPNVRIKSGAFPLYIAAQNGFSNIALELLKAGANKYLTYKGFGTPERIATKRKHTECAELIQNFEYPSETDGWDPDNSATECRACRTAFSFTVRKHHCRQCKHIFCADCTTKKKLVHGLAHLGEIKVCDGCFAGNNGRPRSLSKKRAME